jgi:hypothetical protein
MKSDSIHGAQRKIMAKPNNNAQRQIINQGKRK